MLKSMEPIPDIIFGGDFNLPNISWPFGTPGPKSSPDERLMIDSLINYRLILYFGLLVRIWFQSKRNRIPNKCLKLLDIGDR